MRSSSESTARCHGSHEWLNGPIIASFLWGSPGVIAPKGRPLNLLQNIIHCPAISHPTCSTCSSQRLCRILVRSKIIEIHVSLTGLENVVLPCCSAPGRYAMLTKT